MTLHIANEFSLCAGSHACKAGLKRWCAKTAPRPQIATYSNCTSWTRMRSNAHELCKAHTSRTAPGTRRSCATPYGLAYTPGQCHPDRSLGCKGSLCTQLGTQLREKVCPGKRCLDHHEKGIGGRGTDHSDSEPPVKHCRRRRRLSKMTTA